MTLAVLGMSGGEFVIVAVAVLILFGAKRIPEFAKGLGQGIKEFKKASREVTDEIQTAMDQPDKSATTSKTASKPADSTPDSTVPKA